MKNKTFGRVTILNHEEVVNFQAHDNSVLIRIGDTADEFLPLSQPEQYVNILELTFHDLEYRVGLPSNVKLFDSQMANTLYTFFQENKNHSLVVHCHAGISRSSAVGICYQWFHHEFNKVDSMLQSKLFIPNYEVLKHFNKLLQRFNEEELRQRFSRYSEENYVYNVEDY